MRVFAQQAGVARPGRSAQHQLQRRHLNLGVLKENPKERRVTMVPAVAQKFIKDGYKLKVETGAGARSGFSDAAYKEAGCEVMARDKVIADSKLVFGLHPVEDKELAKFKDKMLVNWVGRMLPAGKSKVAAAAKAGCTLVDTTAAPRITIAQKLDVLSSQAKVAGHRAVIEAAYAFEKFHSPEVTAAGKYPPSNTFVLGVGVAGLAAMGTSKALGSQVRAWDVRDVSDQVQSMGAKWVTVDFKEDGAGAGGYAKESSPEFLKAQKDTFTKHCKECDIVITTAAIPGRPSPKLIEDHMVKAMKPGSVIVDLAAAGGGNCTMTKPGQTVVTDNGVTIIGFDDLPGRMGNIASSMYAQNLYNFISHVHGKEKAEGFLPAVDAALAAGEDGDIIVRSMVTCKDGKELAMPPPPQPTPVSKPKVVEAKEIEKVDPKKEMMQTANIIAGTGAGIIAIGTGVPPALLNSFTLAGAAGYQVVMGVAHALHTPLMSVTNAISGATALGGMMLLGKGGIGTDLLAATATSISAVNIVGGFMVTKKMLDLFKRPGDVDHSNLLAIPGALVVATPILGGSEFIEPVNTVSGLMCIGAIGGLSKMSTADMGCKLGMCGIAGATSTTLMSVESGYTIPALALLGAGGAGGYHVANMVSPIQLPQTVAAFHSLVGGAAMLASIASFAAHPEAGATMHNTSALLGDFIGGVTLTGSIVAFMKLDGRLDSKPLNLPHKNLLNLGGLGLQGLIASHFLSANGGMMDLWATAVISNVMGYHLVGSVGGADMPVCITVLNSYSGWALVAEGFLLNSPILTVVGSLIGFSGGILTKIMCDAMNRDIMNVLFGGMNVAAPAAQSDAAPKEHVETNIEATANQLASASKVLIVPGYGMAVSRAQTACADLANTLIENGVQVEFGIHPVAGRMPGQMNVLLAEAGVSYDHVLEMDEVNPDISDVDVTLVVGANDITNSAAQEVEGCSIWGMPVIEVWKSKKTVFMKRTMGGGYADLENPVFFKDNTEMLLGDAKGTCEGLATKVKEVYAGN
mmetsp:Transcript_9299/g.22846  ORF Transcript_9299/g.22846 Transcript_9299/m.22846 type:complete len:1027 (-) Transcript_9299:900-3980(-)|eukprot:CAMPEP_0178991042 /NCGR_PEP_ID=MMETSP0795-20121207/5302_1 /TAXON_ID=88552 /ORGANISM="Amoebophrya sp., Strain Ameob2" /LENGTH=1026 /DNA_ID=CAMNT_0020682695 /DNA_START=175 /DNA_END=3255 /DNA_ORIENTATION=-